MKPKSINAREGQPRMLLAITLLAGILGLFFLLMPDGMMLTFLVTIASIGGLAGSRKTFDERENQLIWQSYASAFETLFMVVYAAYAFVVFSGWLGVGTEITAFANARWPGLVASAMCILVGLTGLRSFRKVD
jgi:hypothetical protein